MSFHLSFCQKKSAISICTKNDMQLLMVIPSYCTAQKLLLLIKKDEQNFLLSFKKSTKIKQIYEKHIKMYFSYFYQCQAWSNLDLRALYLYKTI